MPAIPNARHEKFCHLVAGGKTYTEAYKLLYPNSNTAAQSGYGLYHTPKIQQRIEEFREEVALRAVMELSRKREVLRQMAEGMIPTKTYNKETGETFDALAALLADAKIAGEFAPEKLQINSAQDLKLLFNVPHRDVIDAEVVQLPEPQTLPVGEVVKNDQNEDLTSENPPVTDEVSSLGDDAG
jgi:hypothetical protein